MTKQDEEKAGWRIQHRTSGLKRYRVVSPKGRRYVCYTLSGARRFIAQLTWEDIT